VPPLDSAPAASGVWCTCSGSPPVWSGCNLTGTGLEQVYADSAINPPVMGLSCEGVIGLSESTHHSLRL
jgi:hypothetical protein